MSRKCRHREMATNLETLASHQMTPLTVTSGSDPCGCYDPNIPHDWAGSETPPMAPRARSLSEAVAFPFSHYTADDSDIRIHIFRCFITSLISLNIVITIFPLITCS
jgi:hypothetical protein